MGTGYGGHAVMHILRGSLTALKRSQASAPKTRFGGQLKEALRAAVDQFKVPCRSAPRICRMRRQIRYLAWHMEDARAAKNDGRLLSSAAEGKRGEEALLAIGDAHIDEMLTDPIRPGQMHLYVASSDPEIREVV